MKFLLSEGRVVCLLDADDGTQIQKNKLPDIELLLIPAHLRDHIERSHLWPQILPKVKKGLRNVIYF